MQTSFTLKTYKRLWLHQITHQDKELAQVEVYSHLKGMQSLFIFPGMSTTTTLESGGTQNFHEAFKGRSRWQVPVERVLLLIEQLFLVLSEPIATGLVFVAMLEEFLRTIRFCCKMTLIKWYFSEKQHLYIFILHVGWDSLDLVSIEMDWKSLSYHSATPFPCPKTSLFLLSGANKEGYLWARIGHKFSETCRKDMK